MPGSLSLEETSSPGRAPKPHWRDWQQNEEELQHITKRINTSMNSAMNKTEFNPLSYKEGLGIVAALEDDEKLIKPIKVDRISVDGISESLENKDSKTIKVEKVISGDSEVGPPKKPIDKSKVEKSKSVQEKQTSKVQKKSDLKNGPPPAHIEFDLHGSCSRRCAFCPRVDEKKWANLVGARITPPL